MNGIRAFFALALEGDAKAAAARELERLRALPGADAVRFVRGDGLHVTLRFLGEIPHAQVAPLATAVGAELAPLAPFDATLGAVHAFPSARRPRVVALELLPEAPFTALAAAVERGVVATGFAPEPRPFRAHLTLGRVRPGRRLDPSLAAPAEAPAAAPTSFPVRSIVLYQSTLAPEGSTYTPLERLPLGGDDHPRSTPSKE
ncbi:MAG TPA: RNA 2',3'-cyclic phosphodiesterase [Myxococcota bacterium]|nr:RNA 2',3'-cyclic phosphodiesterase [Myxococcota bacterium]